MANLLSIIEGLYQWLENYQINANPIELTNYDGKWYIEFTHVVKGRIVRELPRSRKQYVRIEGIGFGVDRQINGDPKSVYCYDQGAIYDPIDGYIPGDHYATSHFALIAAILYRYTSDQKFLDHIMAAVNFSIRKGKNYAFHEWPSHWEFDNFAWIEVHDLLKMNISEDLLRNIKILLDHPYQHHRPFATNWKLLAVNYLRRYQNKGLFSLEILRQAFTKNGSIKRY